MTTKQLLIRLAKLLVVSAVLIFTLGLLGSERALTRVATELAPKYVSPSAEQIAKRENAITQRLKEEYPSLVSEDCSHSSPYFEKNCESSKALARLVVSREPQFLHPKEAYDRKEIEPRVEMLSNAVGYSRVVTALALGLILFANLWKWFRTTAYPALAPHARGNAKRLNTLLTNNLADRRMSAAAGQFEALEKLLAHGAITDEVYKAKREEIRSRLPADLK